MTTLTKSSAEIELDQGYPDLEVLVRSRIEGVAEDKVLFTTQAGDLFQLWLSNLDADHRQHYNCHCCRRFIERFGPLVRIDDVGETWPLLWAPEHVPEFFQVAVAKLWRAVKTAKVTGVFIWKETMWGTPQTGTWTHLSGEVVPCRIPATKKVNEVIAEKLEDYKMLKHGLADYNAEVVQAAHRVLEADALDRSEKTLGVAKFFLDLHQSVQANRERRDNVVWRAVATAPPGFCHVRSTMISTLLDDLKAGMDLPTITERWRAKMHPLQYRRPTAPISEGQVKAANKIMEQMQASGSLTRRFARLADITHRIWEPRPVQEEAKQSGGLFDHLLNDKTGKLSDIELPSKAMTWVKFRDEVLPGALEIELRVPLAPSSFVGVLTAVNPEAPVLFQWGNHVSWYLYHNGSHAGQWNLTARNWVRVPLLTCLPAHWTDASKQAHQSQGLIFVLAGARDTRHQRGGLWFPETLKAEYYEIKAAMEHYSNNAKIEGLEEGDANGLLLQQGQNWSTELRVRSKSGLAHYKLDRWD